MDNTIKIKINGIEDAKRFVSITLKYDSLIDLLSESYIVNGKSILGVLSLDLNKDLYARINSDDIDEYCKFTKDMEGFK